jgi:hypothetical protein
MLDLANLSGVFSCQWSCFPNMYRNVSIPCKCCIQECNARLLAMWHIMLKPFLLFFRFPLSNPKKLKTWLDALRMEDFVSTRYHYLCPTLLRRLLFERLCPQKKTER